MTRCEGRCRKKSRGSPGKVNVDIQKAGGALWERYFEKTSIEEVSAQDENLILLESKTTS